VVILNLVSFPPPLRDSTSSHSLLVIVDAAQLLLTKGASLTLKDKYGRTALDQARRKGHESVVRVVEQATSSK
jgi:ankyrin repeat protein